MAGGPHAAATACLRCAERAERVSEGSETDFYRCGRCGCQFGMDFDALGEPTKPLWPITPEERAQILGATGTTGSRKSDQS